jgi:arylsulfatase A-like enzyme
VRFRHLRAGAALLLAFALDSFGQQSPAPPNILLILSDDHAFQTIGAYGSRINHTPSIDRLAREGMVFDRAFVTNSICAPSRAVILTGKYSHLNGMIDNSHTFDGAQQTFPKLLQKAGYQTAIVGKWHLVSDPTGFDYWQILIDQGPYYNPPMIDNGRRVRHTGYTTDIITNLGLDWLEKRDRNKPFLLMLQHKATHRIWEPAPEDMDRYEDRTFPEPPTLFDDYSGRKTPARTQDMMIATKLNDADLKLQPPADMNAEQLERWKAAYGPRNETFRKAGLTGPDLVRWKYQRFIKDYLRCVDSLDRNIGRVLDYLDTSGLARNTLVVYASDQGFFVGEHGWFDKRWMYEESLRTPLIVRWPGVARPGSRSRDMVLNLDLPETFLDAAGVAVPADMQGRSLRSILARRTPADWRRSLYYHYYEFPGPHNVARHYGVRTERYKLIHFYTLGEWELYDLEKDPGEMRSLYGDSAYRKVEAELKAELDRLRSALRVPEDTRPVR